jgi:MFS family permease
LPDLVVGLYIRLGILETPVFWRLVAERKIERAPMIEAIRRPKEIVLTALCRMAEQGPFYIFAAFIFAYGTQVLHTSHYFLLVVLLIASVASFFVIPISGHLSDLIGCKRMYLIGAVTMGVYAFVYFALLHTAIPLWIALAIVLSFVPHDMMWGPQAALIAECTRRGCATAASRSAFTCPRSPPAGRRCRSRRRCLAGPGRATSCFARS